MDKAIADALANKIQISKEYVVREEYEMLLLKELYESSYGSSLMFKGGTALRLAYGSARFSEDLDFTLLRAIDTGKFMEFLRELGKKYPGIIDVVSHEKLQTLFALVKIKADSLDRIFSIKIEISKRAGKYVRGRDYRDTVIQSEVVPLTVLARVASLSVILAEKEDAMKHRKVARDVFDSWYINQLLKKDGKVDFSGYDTKQVKSELHKLLARPYWRLIDTWGE